MASRLWLNLALLLLIGILVLVVVYEPGKETEPQIITLTQLAPDKIKHIHLKRVTGEDIELVKESDGQWWMYNPYHLPANDFRVQSLLRLVEAESLSMHPLKDLQPATYGLESPRAIVTFNRTKQIKFGDTEPLQQRRYIQVGDKLHTIADTFYYQAAGNPTIYLSYKLLPPDVNIVKLILPDLQLIYQDDQWQRSPSHSQLSADANIELINHWQHAQALELSPTDVTDGKADIEIHLQHQTEPIRFKLQKTEEGIRLLRLGTGLQYLIADDVYKHLISLPEPDQDITNSDKPSQ